MPTIEKCPHGQWISGPWFDRKAADECNICKRDEWDLTKWQEAGGQAGLEKHKEEEADLEDENAELKAQLKEATEEIDRLAGGRSWFSKMARRSNWDS